MLACRVQALESSIGARLVYSLWSFAKSRNARFGPGPAGRRYLSLETRSIFRYVYIYIYTVGVQPKPETDEGTARCEVESLKPSVPTRGDSHPNTLLPRERIAHIVKLLHVKKRMYIHVYITLH